ncbi:MAG TPA: TIGR04063 family PEP-CTERM/XrtA system glycosyltransferase [Burkholderiales bacterium]|jgi:PEP-CTERM/exosortase A-associated glycosyltransferase|nr:TIGR04063 family PEP-CTERM/XrtA system glycosyltransferase [Burkholderiales bacterium]
MRILHILDHSIPLHSGYAFRTVAILREQRKLGWETFHLTGPKQLNCSAMEEDVDGLHFYRTAAASGVLTSIPGLNEMRLIRNIERRLSDVAREVAPQVMHAHSPVLNALPALSVSRRMRVPLVYEVRAFWEDAAADHGTGREWGPRYRLTRALETWAFKRADAVTTICEGLKREIIARGIPERKVTVIPNAVNVEHFSNLGEGDPALRKELDLDGAEVLGFIGSFYAYEGLTVLLKALPKILSERKNARILLVGGGPQERALRDLAREFEGRVIMTGRVPHTEVQRYYDLIDILVYPRLPMRLTDLVTPLKPLEAMAQGRLVLASDVGGHRELIEDGRTGFLFKSGDESDLAQKALTLLKQKESWAAIKVNAREFVEKERNWTASVARYRDVYAGLTC